MKTVMEAVSLERQTLVLAVGTPHACAVETPAKGVSGGMAKLRASRAEVPGKSGRCLPGSALDIAVGGVQCELVSRFPV